jgi:hypothetical protein
VVTKQSGCVVKTLDEQAGVRWLPGRSRSFCTDGRTKKVVSVSTLAGALVAKSGKQLEAEAKRSLSSDQSDKQGGEEEV